jgi:hypothetical protein
LVYAHFFAGRIDEAKASAQRVVDLEPDFSIRRFTGDQVHEAGAAMLGDALRQAGLPE